ncbi:MAG: hypothetical protein ACFFCW_36255 [Candidatus Hodarchaeota archaeon]
MSENSFLNFLTDNALVIGIIGAIVAFFLAITETIAKRKKTRYVFVLAILGFVILILQQVIQYSSEKSSSEIIGYIKQNVEDTRVTVDKIAARLETVSLENLGKELVSVESNRQAAQSVMFAFSKGSPEKWPLYADWLSEMQQKKNSLPCLYLTLNANKRYRIGLLLAYLLTGTDNRIRLAMHEIVGERDKWKVFPDNEFIKQFGIAPDAVQYVLFYDRNPSNMIGYADAKDFVKELLLYRSLGQSQKIETLFNSPQDDARKALRQKFSSVKTHIVIERDISKIVNTMIEEDTSEIAVIDQQRRYLIKLERVIKLAATS